MYKIRQTIASEAARSFYIEEKTAADSVKAWTDVKHISSTKIRPDVIDPLASELEHVTFYDASEYSPILLAPDIFVRAYVLGTEWWFYTAGSSSAALTALLDETCSRVSLTLQPPVGAVQEVSLRELKYSRIIPLDILEGKTIEYDTNEASPDYVRVPSRVYQPRGSQTQQRRIIKEKPKVSAKEKERFYKKEEHSTSLEMDLFALTKSQREELVAPLCITTSSCHREMAGAYIRLIASQVLTLQTLLRNIAKAVGHANLSSLFWLAKRTASRVQPLFNDCEIKDGARQDEPNIRKYKFYAEQQEHNLSVCRDFLSFRPISLTSDEAQCRGYSFLADENPQLFAKKLLSLDDIVKCSQSGVLQSSEVEEMLDRLDEEAAALGNEEIEELEASDNKLDQDIAALARRQIEKLKEDDERLEKYMKELSVSE